MCECVAVVVVVVVVVVVFVVVVVVVPSTSSSGRGPRSYILDAQDGSGLRKMNSGEVAAGIAGGMTPAIINGRNKFLWPSGHWNLLGSLGSRSIPPKTNASTVKMGDAPPI